MLRLLRDREIHFVAALTALAGLVRFAFIVHQSFWYDEAVTASLVTRPLWTMLRALPSSETAPPFYYGVAWAWVRLFGSSDLALRSLSAVAGTLTVPVLYAAARVLVSRRAGVVAATLAACSSLLVWYSQEARAYSLLVLLSALSVLAFALVQRTPTRMRVTWWALVACLAVATYYYAALLVLAEAALLLFRRRRSGRLWIATGLIVATSAALLPLAIVQARTGNAAWIHGTPLHLRMEETVRQFVTPAPAPRYAGGSRAAEHTSELWTVGALVLALAVASALRYGDGKERAGLWTGLGLAGAVVVPPLVVSLAAPLVLDDRSDSFLYRGLLPAWPPLTIAIAAGLGARRAPGLALLVVGGLAAASLALTAATVLDPNLQRDDVRGLAAASQGEDLVVVFPEFERRPLLRYGRQLEPAPPSGVSARTIIVAVRKSRDSPRPYRPPGSFGLVGEERLQRFVIRRYRSPVAVRFGPRGVSASARGYAVLVRRRST